MSRKNAVYSGEFRLEVVEYMQEHGISAKVAARHFKINEDIPKRWMRTYLEEGEEALLKKRRSHTPKSGTSSSHTPKSGTSGSRLPKPDEEAEEDLIAEVQRLRMENEYLKKLNALVQEKEKSVRQKKQK